ncbi:nucleotidyltransferase family protein [Streptococcus sp. 20-1249]|uniref:nucleotidyltransferase family protein n=1 Tax=Streptococcus hepaticus TaxID=3349163 RepID=UPI00374A978C
MENWKKFFWQDADVQQILQIIKHLHLKDSWLCAGSVRNFIWNVLSDKPGFDRETDVDVIFYDPAISYEETCQLENELRRAFPQYCWELKNQVYMHVHNPNTLPYTDSRDAMSKYPETCTAIGLRLDENNGLELFAPYGLQVIEAFRVEPTPHFLADKERRQVYNARLKKKNWIEKWPNLKIQEIVMKD